MPSPRLFVATHMYSPKEGGEGGQKGGAWIRSGVYVCSGGRGWGYSPSEVRKYTSLRLLFY